MERFRILGTLTQIWGLFAYYRLHAGETNMLACYYASCAMLCNLTRAETSVSTVNVTVSIGCHHGWSLDLVPS